MTIEMQQLIDLMTKDITDDIEDIIEVESDFYVVKLVTGEVIIFTRE